MDLCKNKKLCDLPSRFGTLPAEEYESFRDCLSKALAALEETEEIFNYYSDEELKDAFKTIRMLIDNDWSTFLTADFKADNEKWLSTVVRPDGDAAGYGGDDLIKLVKKNLEKYLILGDAENAMLTELIGPASEIIEKVRSRGHKYGGFRIYPFVQLDELCAYPEEEEEAEEEAEEEEEEEPLSVSARYRCPTSYNNRCATLLFAIFGVQPVSASSDPFHLFKLLLKFVDPYLFGQAIAPAMMSLPINLDRHGNLVLLDAFLDLQWDSNGTICSYISQGSCFSFQKDSLRVHTLTLELIREVMKDDRWDYLFKFTLDLERNNVGKKDRTQLLETFLSQNEDDIIDRLFELMSGEGNEKEPIDFGFHVDFLTPKELSQQCNENNQILQLSSYQNNWFGRLVANTEPIWSVAFGEKFKTFYSSHINCADKTFATTVINEYRKKMDLGPYPFVPVLSWEKKPFTTVEQLSNFLKESSAAAAEWLANLLFIVIKQKVNPATFENQTGLYDEDQKPQSLPKWEKKLIDSQKRDRALSHGNEVLYKRFSFILEFVSPFKWEESIHFCATAMFAALLSPPGNRTQTIFERIGYIHNNSTGEYTGVKFDNSRKKEKKKKNYHYDRISNISRAGQPRTKMQRLKNGAVTRFFRGIKREPLTFACVVLEGAFFRKGIPNYIPTSLAIPIMVRKLLLEMHKEALIEYNTEVNEHLKKTQYNVERIRGSITERYNKLNAQQCSLLDMRIRDMDCAPFTNLSSLLRYLNERNIDITGRNSKPLALASSVVDVDNFGTMDKILNRAMWDSGLWAISATLWSHPIVNGMTYWFGLMNPSFFFGAGVPLVVLRAIMDCCYAWSKIEVLDLQMEEITEVVMALEMLHHFMPCSAEKRWFDAQDDWSKEKFWTWEKNLESVIKEIADDLFEGDVTIDTLGSLHEKAKQVALEFETFMTLPFDHFDNQVLLSDTRLEKKVERLQMALVFTNTNLVKINDSMKDHQDKKGKDLKLFHLLRGHTLKEYRTLFKYIQDKPEYDQLKVEEGRTCFKDPRAVLPQGTSPMLLLPPPREQP